MLLYQKKNISHKYTVFFYLVFLFFSILWTAATARMSFTEAYMR